MEMINKVVFAYENEFLAGNSPQYTAALDEDDDNDDENSEGESRSGDWGKTDPAGGDAPSSPGSAV